MKHTHEKREGKKAKEGGERRTQFQVFIDNGSWEQLFTGLVIRFSVTTRGKLDSVWPCYVICVNVELRYCGCCCLYNFLIACSCALFWDLAILSVHLCFEWPNSSSPQSSSESDGGLLTEYMALAIRVVAETSATSSSRLGVSLFTVSTLIFGLPRVMPCWPRKKELYC